MKIRAGFVSNSSSSSFTCYLPEKWNIDDEEILKAADYARDTEEDEDILKSVKKAINKIKKGGSISEYDNYFEFTVLQHLIPHEFIQSSQDVPSDCGEIAGISLEKIDKIIKEFS